MAGIFETRPRKQSSLTSSEIGVAAGGALLVYLAPGDMLPDGRPKFDPMRPDDKVLLGDMEGVWDIGRHLDEWAAAPAHGPQVLIAIYGPKVTDRHIAAAVRIDTTRWLDPSLKAPERNRWNVPLVNPPDMNARSLRGRQVDGIRFGQFSWQLHIWVDAQGVQQHPVP
jgi:hypothetical protein